MDWSDDVIHRLRSFWAEGLSTAEIGRRLGVSKNAIVGKAHRLSLTARPSPIRRAPAGEPVNRPAPTRSSAPELPPMSAPSVVPPPPPGAPVPPMLRTISRPIRRQSSCCWPIGEPGTPSFRFCDAGALAGKPYCAPHASLAYVRVRDRREDAA